MLSLTEDQLQAYVWAKNQNYTSIAAQHAKTLAAILEQISDKPKPRSNAGYELKEEIHCGESKFVLGFNPNNQIVPYVTWQENLSCGGFCFGHYLKTLEDARKDLFRRSIDALDLSPASLLTEKDAEEEGRFQLSLALMRVQEQMGLTDENFDKLNTLDDFQNSGLTAVESAHESYLDDLDEKVCTLLSEKFPQYLSKPQTINHQLKAFCKEKTSPLNTLIATAKEQTYSAITKKNTREPTKDRSDL